MDLYNTFIDYEQSENLGVRSIADHVAMKQIAESNFDMEKKPLIDVLSDRTFDVPEYQRLFSWKTRHHRQLWADIQEFINADLRAGEENISDVFFSSVYFAVNAQEATFEIIDGQQRLTSIHILLRTILERLQDLNGDEFEDETVATLRENGAGQIESILYKQGGVVKGNVPRLTLNKHDDEFFEALISGAEPQLRYLCSEEREYIDGRRGEAAQIYDLIEEFGISQSVIDDVDPDRSKFSEYIPIYDSNWRLLDGYSYYRDQVAELVDGRDDADSKVLALINLSNYIQQSYYVGEFIIREAKPDFRMQIFEILNDRGLELTKIDRIRAAVVNAFFDEDDKEKYVTHWESIVVAFATDNSRIDDYLSVYLSIIDSDIDTLGEASSELTNAFATRNLDSDVRPRLKDLDDARPFLTHAHDLVPYYKDITNPGHSQDFELDDYADRCREILIRLDNQRMDQWRPLVLALYHHTHTSSSGSEEEFYNTLDAIEKLNFRRLFVGVNPNRFQEIFIDAVHEFQRAQEQETTNPYERARRYLINQAQSIAPPLFAERFRDTIIQSQSWNPDHVKLLFAKIANQWFRDHIKAVDQKLNMEKIHLEHVLPQSLVYDTNDPIWLPEFFEFGHDNVEVASEIRRYIKLTQRDDSALTGDEKRQRESIEDFITQRFVDDIGNFVLLYDRDNIKASNRPLVEKIPEYFNEAGEFSSIHPNRYFTPEYGAIDQDRFNRLMTDSDNEEGVGEDEAVDAEIIEYFNSFWTYDALKQRRVDLIIDLLEAVSFEEINDEFGLETEPERVRQNVRTQTDSEFENRLSMRTL